MALTEASPRNRTVTATGPIFQVVLAGTVSAGDALGYSSGWKRALATTGTAIQAEIIALESGVSGDVIAATCSAVITGFSGGTPGNAVYLEEGAGVGGGYTQTAPSTAGDVNTIIGVILTATQILLWPGNRAPTTA